jgi:hypothetical protein
MTDFRKLFEQRDSLDLTEVAEIEQSSIRWEADGSIVISLVERGEVTVRRDGSEITVISEKSARDITREVLFSTKSESYDRVIESLEKMNELFKADYPQDILGDCA